MSMNFNNIINYVIGMLLVGLLVPIGLLYVVNSDVISITINETAYTLADANPILGTLMNTILPMMMIITVLLLFIPKSPLSISSRRNR